jgi:peptide/nickel transport system substrate-binding protein
MKRSTVWFVLAFLMVISMVLASCNSKTTTGTPITTTTTTAGIATTTTSTSSISSTTTTSTALTTTVSTTSTGHWWDSLGTPVYGGTCTFRISNNILSWDPYLGTIPVAGYYEYLETPFINAYTTDPAIYDFSTSYLPPEFADGYMLTGYEMPSTTTFIEHLRKNIYWQNQAPANGRQFVASDVVYHYNRMLGLGSGFTTVDPYYSTQPIASILTSITATDSFTVVFQFKAGTNPLLIENTLQATGTSTNSIECPELIAAYTTASNPVMADWHHAVGTGAFMLTDFVDSSSATYIANPNYWYSDERWPQNKLPYIHSIVQLIISNSATSLAAMRVGKIDAGFVLATDAANLAKTNPEIIQSPQPQGNETTYNMRVDVKPFSDINVRIALQEAINMPLIASTYYNGQANADPMGLTSNIMGVGGWGIPYSSWPAALKTQYAYNQANSKTLLAAAGYPSGFTTDIVAASYVDQGLLQVVQSEFASVGVTMSIQLVDSATYNSYVIASHKDDAMFTQTQGMLGLAQDPFSTLIHFTTGSSTNPELVSDSKIDAWYAQAQAATTVDQVKQILHDESLYVAQQFYAVNISDPYQFIVRQPWVKGMQGKMGGTSVQNQDMGSFCYGDWVDQSIKNAYSR